ncbi:Pr6Pr family membrane protein [uncultured Pseudokineococcus sp.]|uniref:Pr6Pr family membrane protein n=1 Tax=uncultured Pseudokineococcus sp. TaxID=1642928 RepID=UPI002615389D|nr:Pr6Pr family membrane protein [uncultured Pseudokineococcus sp.]
MSDEGQRAWWGLTGAVAAVCVVLQVALAATSGAPEVGARVVRSLSYFTIDTNALVAVLGLLVAARPDRTGPWWRALRLGAPLCIVVVGVIYHVELRQQGLTGIDLVLDTGLHYVVPALALVGWLLATPRGLADVGAALRALVYPVVWLVWTFAHGAVTGWYPYPFLDVTEVGAGGAAVGVALVALLLGVLAVAAVAGDRAVARRRSPAPRG